MWRLIPRTFLLLAVAMVVYGVLFPTFTFLCWNGTPLVYRLGGALNYKGGNSWRKFTEFDPQGGYDAVFIGSSHAYRGYDPRIFARQGYRTFNIGTSAQSPLNTRAIVESMLSSATTLLLVIDVYEGAFCTDGLESTADLTQNISSDAAALRMVSSLRDPRGLNMLALRWLLRNAPPTYADSAYVAMGFSERTDSLNGPGVEHAAMPPVSTAQQGHFRKILRSCNERGIPVLLVDHPAPSTADRDRHARFASWVRSEADAYGVPYIDLAFDHGLPLDDLHHFYDHNHLNQAGVRLFNERLIVELEQRGLLR